MPSSQLRSGVGPQESRKKNKKNEDSNKPKYKSPFYKLQLDIKNFINMKMILEENIFDAKIEFSLKEAFGITKKDFYKLIINAIKKKRKMTSKEVMVKVLDFYLIKKEDQEIRQVFFQLCAPRFDEMLLERKKEVTTQGYGRDKDQREARSSKEVDHGVGINEVNMSYCTFHRKFEVERMIAQFVHFFWIRTTIEIQVRVGDLKEHTLKFIIYRLEINMMIMRIYEMDK